MLLSSMQNNLLLGIIFLTIAGFIKDVSSAQQVKSGPPSFCKFPFIYKDISYSACSTKDDPNGRLWCSTKTDWQNNHIKDNWKHCETECGSFSAISHLSIIDDRIRDYSDNFSPLSENGAMASLHSSSTYLGSSTHKCGATLISNNYLLTAAHCLVNDERIVSISMGREDLDVNPSPGPDTYGIQEFHIHPNYRQSDNKYFDIAILKTSRTVEYKKKIWPFCLPNSYQEFHDYFPVNIAGWGQVNQSHTASYLQTASIKLIKDSRCVSEWRRYASDLWDLISQFSYPQGLNNQILCGGKHGVDACRGDSGGPMSYQNADGLFTAIGLIANGVNCPIEPITPGFYTDIRFYLDWIYETTGLPKPSILQQTHPVATTVLTRPTTKRPQPPQRTNNCPEGYVSVGSQCFFVPKKDLWSEEVAKPETWTNAQKKCKEQGGILAEPRTLLSFWNEFSIEKNNAGYWLGGSDEKEEGEWIWASDEAKVGSPNSWYAGEPSNDNKKEHCLFLMSNVYPALSDRPCYHKCEFICEKKIG